MNISVDGWAAVIYAHMLWVERLEQIFTSCQRVIQVNRFIRNAGHEHISPQMHASAMKACCCEKVAQTWVETCGKVRDLLYIRGHASTFAGG